MLTQNIDQMRAEIAEHIAADAVRGGHYWDGQTGCFIGCLAHSSRAETLTERFGLPLPLVRIAEVIFERLPAPERPVFFREIGEAIGRDGRDLTRVHWAFFADTLRHHIARFRIGDVAPLIDDMDRLARADAEANADAEAAAAAAVVEAWKAAWAAQAAVVTDAAWEAETERRRRALLLLIADSGAADA